MIACGGGQSVERGRLVRTALTLLGLDGVPVAVCEAPPIADGVPAEAPHVAASYEYALKGYESASKDALLPAALLFRNALRAAPPKGLTIACCCDARALAVLLAADPSLIAAKVKAIGLLGGAAIGNDGRLAPMHVGSEASDLGVHVGAAVAVLDLCTAHSVPVVALSLASVPPLPIARGLDWAHQGGAIWRYLFEATAQPLQALWRSVCEGSAPPAQTKAWFISTFCAGADAAALYASSDIVPHLKGALPAPASSLVLLLFPDTAPTVTAAFPLAEAAANGATHRLYVGRGFLVPPSLVEGQLADGSAASYTLQRDTMIDKAANAAAAVHGLPPLPAKKMGVGSARAQRARAELKALQGGAANKKGAAKKAAPKETGEARALRLMKQRVTLGIATLDKAQEATRGAAVAGGATLRKAAGEAAAKVRASVGAVSDDALEKRARGARLDAHAATLQKSLDAARADADASREKLRAISASTKQFSGDAVKEAARAPLAAAHAALAAAEARKGELTADLTTALVERARAEAAAGSGARACDDVGERGAARRRRRGERRGGGGAAGGARRLRGARSRPLRSNLSARAPRGAAQVGVGRHRRRGDGGAAHLRRRPRQPARRPRVCDARRQAARLPEGGGG